MTTVAVNREQIAADRMMSHSGGLVFQSKSKIYSIDNILVYPKPFHIAFCGDVGISANILEYFYNPVEWKAPKGMMSVEFLALTADHKIYNFSDPRKWLPVTSKYYAIGSGCHFAMAAMEMGKSPYEAVKIACKLDKNTGLGVTKIDVT